MGENTNQLEREIRAERQQLGRNLTELEMKARQLADWRTYYRHHPKLLLGIALGGGLMLGALAGRARPPVRDTHERMPRPSRARSGAGAQIEETWQRISDALLGVVSARVVEFVSNFVPGFSHQLDHRPSGSEPAESLRGVH